MLSLWNFQRESRLVLNGRIRVLSKWDIWDLGSDVDNASNICRLKKTLSRNTNASKQGNSNLAFKG